MCAPSQRLLVACSLVAAATLAAGCGREASAPVSAARRAVETPVWTRLQPMDAPESGSGAAMAYHPGLEEMVLHGGVGAGGFVSQQTWSWDGARWAHRCPSAACGTGPGPIIGAAMATGPGDTVVLTGGCTGGCSSAADFSSLTWVFNGTAWTSIANPGGMQAVRDASLAFDPAQQRVVLYGGQRADGVLTNDTWMFDGTAWSAICTGACASGLSTRRRHAMAYGVNVGAFIMYGGYTSGGGLYSDTWQLKWMGTNYAWSPITPTTNAGPLAEHVMIGAAPSSPKNVVMMGGRTNPSGALNVIEHEWNGSAWTPWSAAGLHPGPRTAAAGAYDPIRAVFVLWGGVLPADGSPYGDVWESGYPVSWAQRAMGPRTGHGMVSVPTGTLGSAAIFGGAAGQGLLNDVWMWTVDRWDRKVPGSATVPPRRQDHAAVWDESKNQMVVMGGYGASSYSDTWVFAAPSWSKSCDPCAFAAPGAGLSGASAAYDKTRNTIVLFGGWDGATGKVTSALYHGVYSGSAYTWTLGCDATCQASGPVARAGAAMAYDVARGVTVLFGGCKGNCVPFDDFMSDTWEWNGTSWSHSAAAGPTGSYHAAMTYDRARKRIVMMGGVDRFSSSDVRVWEYDGFTWQVQPDANRPTDWRQAPGLAYEHVGKRVLLHGGVWGSEVRADTWALSSYGGTCSTSADCDDGYPCVTGVCCSTACPGSCAACSVAAGSSADGVCGNASPGTSGNPVCADHTLCSGASPECPAGCAGDDGCELGYFCHSSGSCRPQVALGSGCNLLADCKSPDCRECGMGTCVDGVCCESACDGLCAKCTAGTGKCDPLADGQEENGECGDTAHPTCGLAVCNGNYQCRFPGPSNACGVQSCTNGTLKLASTCDGFGGCAPPATQSCNGFLCDQLQPDQCGTSCTANTTSGCVSGFTCNSSGTACTGGKPAGDSCNGDGECASGVCAGHCCASDCQRADATCGGTCDSSGACSYPKAGDECDCSGTPGVCTADGVCDCLQRDGGVTDGPQQDAAGPDGPRPDAAGLDAPLGDGAPADAVGPPPDGPGTDAGMPGGTTSFLGCSAAPAAGAAALPLPLLLLALAAARRRRS